MERVYKIKSGLEKRVAFRNLSGLAFSALIFTVFVFVMFVSAKGSTLQIFIVFFPITFCGILSVMLFHMSYHYLFFLKLNKGTSFIVNDNSLSKNWDIDTREFGYWQLGAWSAFSRNNPIHVTIQWDDVKSVSLGKYSLKVKSKNAGTFSNKGAITIPKEVENFEELEKAIRSYIHT